jgi:hypothetical protein
MFQPSGRSRRPVAPGPPSQHLAAGQLHARRSFVAAPGS